MKKLFLLAIAIVLFSISGNAQNNAKQTTNNSLLKTWYESPQESKGDIIVFKTTKHVNVPGVDIVGMEYSKLVLNKDNTCILDFAKWCSNHKNHLEGTWASPQLNTIKLNFNNEGCPSELTVISASPNELKVQVKEIQ